MCLCLEVCYYGKDQHSKVPPMPMRAEYLEGSGPMRVLHSDLLAVLARHVLAVGLRELFAVRSEALPVTHPSLVPHLPGHLIEHIHLRLGIPG